VPKIPKRRVSATVTKPYLEALELLVKGEVYESQAEAIRDALRRLFKHYGVELCDIKSGSPLLQDR